MAKAQKPPQLLPMPRELQIGNGTHTLATNKLITISSPSLLFEAQEAQRALSEYCGVTWHLHASRQNLPAAGLHIEVFEASSQSDQVCGDLEHQAYVLHIDDTLIRIQATSNMGAFYGVVTLAQLLRQYGNTLPQLHIEDQPDFAARGYMLDVSRDKVPTMETLFDIVDMLANLKLNELQLYTEHTFAFQNHKTVWADASPITGEEILLLDAYCQKRHINLVPNQNSMGHMHRFLKHKEYVHLAECPDGWKEKWWLSGEPYTLCPTDAGSIKLVEDLFDDLLPNFSSPVFNVGGDEPFDLGEGRSRVACAERGIGSVYLDHMLKVHRLAQKHGRTMQMWGDIVMEHPELVSQLPKDIVVMEWGYEFDHPFDAHGEIFAKAGLPFYVVPGTSSWNSIGGRTPNMKGNLLNAAQAGIKHGAIGFLNTDWGDNGHHQPLSVSFLGLGYGAAVSWCLSENREIDLAQHASTHLFEDATGKFGKVAYEIGEIGTLFPYRTFNGNPYGYAMYLPDDHVRDGMEKNKHLINLKLIHKVEKEIVRLESAAGALPAQSKAQKVIQQEFQFALRLIRHGVNRMARIAGLHESPTTKTRTTAWRELTNNHKKVWLLRNRVGGLKDSIARIQP